MKAIHLLCLSLLQCVTPQLTRYIKLASNVPAIPNKIHDYMRDDFSVLSWSARTPFVCSSPLWQSSQFSGWTADHRQTMICGMNANLSYIDAIWNTTSIIVSCAKRSVASCDCTGAECGFDIVDDVLEPERTEYIKETHGCATMVFVPDFTTFPKETLDMFGEATCLPSRQGANAPNTAWGGSMAELYLWKSKKGENLPNGAGQAACLKHTMDPAGCNADSNCAMCYLGNRSNLDYRFKPRNQFCWDKSLIEEHYWCDIVNDNINKMLPLITATENASPPRTCIGDFSSMADCQAECATDDVCEECGSVPDGKFRCIRVPIA